VSERSRGDASDIDGQAERSKWAGAHESTWATNEFQLRESCFQIFICGFTGVTL
jgi:hypothetical protein